MSVIVLVEGKIVYSASLYCFGRNARNSNDKIAVIIQSSLLLLTPLVSYSYRVGSTVDICLSGLLKRRSFTTASVKDDEQTAKRSDTNGSVEACKLCTGRAKDEALNH